MGARQIVRDAHIRGDRLRGAAYSELAERYELSERRVRHICNRTPAIRLDRPSVPSRYAARDQVIRAERAGGERYWVIGRKHGLSNKRVRDICKRPPAITITLQELNKRRAATRWLTAFGRTLHLSAWAARQGLLRQTIQRRLARGWPVERALSPISEAA